MRILEKEVFNSLYLHIHCSWIENIRSWKPWKNILCSMFSISERDGEKRKDELSIFNNFLISIH